MKYITEWHDLQAALFKSDLTLNLTNNYYKRLLILLLDSNATNIDKLLAYKDALKACPIKDINLPLRIDVNDDELVSLGLTVDAFRNTLYLSNGQKDRPSLFHSDATKPLYEMQKRRNIESYPMDPSLIARLNNKGFSHYKGAAQKMSVRVALLSERNNTLIINLPTGVGKTLVAHSLAAFSEDKELTLIIVPTTGLAIEQGNRIQELFQTMNMDHGGSYFWHGQQTGQQHNDIRQRIRDGAQKVLVTSPESACRSLLPTLFYTAKNNLLANIVIDEAHIVEQWGVSFRPDFQIFSALVHALREKSVSGIKCTLMSATFTQNSIEVLTELFGVPSKQPIEVHGGFLRPEIQYKVHKVNSDQEHQQAIWQAISELPKPMIIYAVKREDAQIVYNNIKVKGIGRIKLFTGATDNNKREKIIERWKKNEVDIVVATSAFGVGMDKTDVRSIVHIAAPENIDRFYQEVGRSGRDGNASQSLLIYQEQDFETAQTLNNIKLISVDLGLGKWQSLWHHGRASENGKRVVDLRTIHQGLSYQSISNQEWNWRTLLLMQRSGLINIEFMEPTPPQWDPSVNEQEYKKSVSSYYTSYYNEVNIVPLNDNHLDRNTWDSKVGPQRVKEKRHQTNNFSVLKNWVRNHTSACLSKTLSEFYTIHNILPELTCGGCPSCEAQNSVTQFFPTLGRNAQVYGLNKCNKWPEGLSFNTLHQSIYYTIENKTNRDPVRALIRNSITWITSLLENKQINIIGTDAKHIGLIQGSLPKGFNRFWAFEPLNPLPYSNFSEDNAYWPELVIVPDSYTQFPKFGDNKSTKLILAKQELPAFSDPNKQWRSVDQHAISLNNFLLSIK